MKYLLPILLFFSLYLHAAPLESGWQYRWGDSLFDANGIPLWSIEEDSDEWKNIDFPSNPEGRDGNTNVWYRYKLPDTLPAEPSIFVFSIDLITQVYVSGKMIYHYGDFDKEGKGKFVGWPWHLIDLPQDAAGKTIYFRVYSDYPDIGLWGEVLLDSKSNHMQKIYTTDMPRFIVGVAAIMGGILFFLVFIANLQSKENLYLSFLLFTQGIDSLLSAQITQFYFYYPLLVQYLIVFSYCFFPIGVALFMSAILENRYRKILTIIWSVHLVYIAFGMMLPLWGVIQLSDVYKPFDTLYYFLTMPILLYIAFRTAYKGDANAKLLFFGYFLMVLAYLDSTIIAMNLVTWERTFTHFTLLAFIVTLSIIAYRKTSAKHVEYGRIKHMLFQQSKKASMGDMIQVITHQWKQPLTIINLGAMNIQGICESKKVDTKEISTICDKIISNVMFMSDTVSDFRDFFAPNKKVDEVSLAKIASSVSEILKGTLRQKDIKLHLPQEDLRVTTVANELSQVFLNLIDNAKDALVANSIEHPEIYIAWNKEGENIKILISDNGGGIDEHSMKNLFQAYFTTKGEKGTGIGLYLCKLIIEESLGGKIRAYNKNGGAVFEIVLPLQKPHTAIL